MVDITPEEMISGIKEITKTEHLQEIAIKLVELRVSLEESISLLNQMVETKDRTIEIQKVHIEHLEKKTAIYAEGFAEIKEAVKH